MDWHELKDRLRGRRGALFIGASGALLALLILALSTSYGFRLIFIPLANHFLPGLLAVEAGSLRLPATLTAEGLSYHDPDSRLTVRVERFRLRLSPLSLLRSRTVVINDLALEGVEVQTTEAAATPRDQPVAAAFAPRAFRALPPWTIHRIQADHATLLLESATGTLRFTDVSLSAEGFGPGRTGPIRAVGTIAIMDSAKAVTWAGNVHLTGTLEQSEDQNTIIWNGTQDLAVREWPALHILVASQPLTVHHAFSGSFDRPAAAFRQDSTLTVRRGTDALGELALTVREGGLSPGTLAEAHLTLRRMTADTLNLVLPGEDLRLGSGEITGDGMIRQEGERYSVALSMKGSRLKFASGAAAASPHDIEIQHEGLLDFPAGLYRTNRLHARAAANDAVIVSADLSQPLTIGLSGGSVESEAARRASPAGGGVELSLHRFPVAELRQWLHLWGRRDVLEGLQGGFCEGTLAISSSGDGRMIALDGRIQVSDLTLAETQAGAATSITSLHEFHGAVVNLDHLQLDSYRVSVRIKGKTRGLFQVSGTFDLAAPFAEPSLKGSFEVTALPAPMLNPLIARWTDGLLGEGMVTGTASVQAQGASIGWRTNLKGTRITFRRRGQIVSSAMDFELAQDGRFDRNERLLYLVNARFKELDGGRPVITAVLDHPVTFQLQGSAAATAGLGTPATLRVDANGLRVEQLKAWLLFWNITALEPVETGLLTGRLVARWGAAPSASLSGHLDVAHLLVRRDALLLRGSLHVQSRIEAVFHQATALELKNLEFQVLKRRALVAEGRVTGSAALDGGSADLAVHVRAPDTSAALAQVGWLARGRWSLATTTVDVRLIRSSFSTPWSVQGTLRAEHLRVLGRFGRSLDYDVLAQGSLEVDAARATVALKPLDLRVDRDGDPAGILTLAGVWPTTPASAGSLHVVSKDFDGAPLADLTALFPGRTPGVLPVTADLTVEREAGTESLTLRGSEILGPLRVARTDGGPDQAVVRLEQDLVLRDHLLHVSRFLLTGERPGGVPDQVTFHGDLPLDEAHTGRFEGEVTSLDAAWYAALLAAVGTSAPGDAAHPVAEAERDIGKPSPSWISVIANVTTDLVLGSISYRTLAIGPGRLTSQRTDGGLDVTLHPTGLAGGRVEATARLDQLRTIKWSGSGEGVDMAAVFSSFTPGELPFLTGTGSFSTSGTGLLMEGPVRRQLTGTAQFTMTDGQFLRSPALRFLAKYTKVDELETLRFDRFETKLSLEEGTIHVDQMSVTGQAASLEGTGRVTPENALDGRLFVKIGSSLRTKVNIPCMSALLATPDGFTTLPFALKVKGTVAQPEYAVDTAAWQYAKGSFGSLAGTMKTLLRGCRQGIQDSGSP